MHVFKKKNGSQTIEKMEFVVENLRNPNIMIYDFTQNASKILGL